MLQIIKLSVISVYIYRIWLRGVLCALRCMVIIIIFLDVALYLDALPIDAVHRLPFSALVVR